MRAGFDRPLIELPGDSRWLKNLEVRNRLGRYFDHIVRVDAEVVRAAVTAIAAGDRSCEGEQEDKSHQISQQIFHNQGSKR